VVSLTGLPHHSGVPRAVALLLALGIVIVGVVAANKPAGQNVPKAGPAAERKRLVARREKLLTEVVRLEADHRNGRGPWADDRRFASRREELITALESVYGALDGQQDGPEPADRVPRQAQDALSLSKGAATSA
jgi:hypothetical protein